ncbi:MAG: LysM peptidoglycan-binding domain-containing protein [Nocardioidaceae bacterium]|nr:LysM peptidoglycan-binding domain-containing protein [Nocardioidaceae bacterium]
MSSTRSRRQQLPVVDVPSRGAQVAQGVAALIGTVLIVVGVPLVLLAAFDVPWPSEPPSTAWLTARLDVDALMGVLAAVVWIAWAHFCVCLVVEAVNERGVRGLAPRVPGGGIGTQGLARRLVAAIVLLVGTAAVTMPSAQAVTAGPQHSITSVSSLASLSPTMDSAASAIEDLPSEDELTRATAADVADQDQGVVTYYDVKPPDHRNYDTLWDIADRYLGDGFRYREIYDLNKGATQPDGRTLTQADLIHPGWVLQMPNDAKGPGLKVVESGLRGPVAPEPAAPIAPDAPDDAGDDVVTAVAPAADDGGTSLAGWAPMFGVAGGLLAGGLALRLRRQRATLGTAQLWAARGSTPDPDPDGPRPDGPPPGVRLRDEADADGARWFDRALRAWGDAAHGALPAPSRCSVGDAGLVLAFSEAPTTPVPAGWTVSDDGRVLSLDRAVDVRHVDAVAPLPGLVTVGRRDDGTMLLIDLESVPGVMSLGGDGDSARALAMSIALDTATHPWADQRVVTLVGFADDVVPVAPESVRQVDDVERVLESLENVARQQRADCRRADTVSAREARLRTGDRQAWTYHLVVCSGRPGAAELERLGDLAADQQVALGVVVVGDTAEASLRLALTPAGRLSAPYHGIDVQAQQLTVESMRLLGDLLPAAPEGAPRVELGDVAHALGAGQVDDQPPAVTIGLLGPIEVDGAGEADPDRVALWTEVAVYLAVHPDGAHLNRLTSAIWPRGVGDDVRDATLEQVGAWLGAGEDGSPRLRTDGGIVSLDHEQVRVDWDRFRSELNRGARLDGPARVETLRGALGLVRGRAWADLPTRRYSWLASMTVESDMELAVSVAARVLAEHGAQNEDGDAARDALQQGLVMCPASEELWRAALRLADRFGGRGDVRAVADQMYAEIAEHGSPLGASAQTDALVDELLPGHRTRAA